MPTPTRSLFLSPSIKAVFFDAGNTLFHPYPSVGHVYARMAKQHGVRVSAAWAEKRFRQEWQRSTKGLRTDHRQEKARWFDLVHRMFLGKFPDDRFPAYFEELHDLFARPQVWRLFPDALPTLSALKRKGYRVGVVSNWDLRLFDLCRGLGVTRRVDFVMASGKEGVSKPAKGIFDRALARSGVKPHEALHVGDSLLEDYHGAQDAGLHALLLCRHGNPPRGVKHLASLKPLTQASAGR